jgi:hypothetical protein
LDLARDVLGLPVQMGFPVDVFFHTLVPKLLYFPLASKWFTPLVMMGRISS